MSGPREEDAHEAVPNTRNRKRVRRMVTPTIERGGGCTVSFREQSHLHVSRLIEILPRDVAHQRGREGCPQCRSLENHPRILVVPRGRSQRIEPEAVLSHLGLLAAPLDLADLLDLLGGGAVALE